MIGSGKKSISQKLTAIILLICTLGIVLISAVVFSMEWVSFRRNMLSNISTLAKLIGANCTAAVAFQDPGTANEILAALTAEPAVLDAVIFSADGKIFARYERERYPDRVQIQNGPDYKRSTLSGETHLFSKRYLELARPISINGKTIGAVQIRASLSDLHSRLKWFLVIMTACMLLFILLAYILSSRLQRFISGPILRLTHHMQTVSRDKNYSIRAEKGGPDEIGILIDGFNDMLEQTQIRDQELSLQRSRLEELVSMRTAELKVSEEQKNQLLFQQKIQEAYGKIVSLLNSIDISDILERSLNEIVPHSNSRWGSFFLYSENSNSLGLTKSLMADAVIDYKTVEALYVRHSSRLAEQVYNSQIEQATGFQDPGGILEGGHHTLTAFPLSFQNMQLGVLVLASGSPFSGWIMSFLKNTSRQLGVAIHNALTFQELRHQSIELEQSNLELAKASQMKSEFLANMSHELRTPLNHIIGFTDLVVDKKFGDLNGIQEEYLNDVLGSSHHLLALINDILDIAKVESGKMELDRSHAEIEEIISSSLNMIKEKAMKKGCTLSRTEGQVPETIYADKRKFKQVLFNLLSNAVKFTPNGGKIEVQSQTIDRTWLDEHLTGIFRDDVLEKIDPECEAFLKVTVTDTGIGIKPDALKTVFEVFQQEDKTTTTQYGGTGLGLSLCKQFIELHKGGIWVDSRVGRGSDFSFLLPIYDMPPVAVSPDNHIIGTQRETPLVLVVDDDEKICRNLSQALISEGYDVLVATDGQAAIDKATELQPDMILLDVMLPKKSGWEVLTRLKSIDETRDIPIVICSGIEDRRQGFALGAFDYLVKPILKKDLLRCLKKAGMDLELTPKQENILIVHEHSDDSQRYKVMLEENGYSVLTAETVKEGMSIAADVKLAMVFHDMITEDESALSFVRQLKDDAVTNNIPVVVLIDKDLEPAGIEKISKDLKRQILASPRRGSSEPVSKHPREARFQIIHNAILSQ